jgi:hypothetical protein
MTDLAGVTGRCPTEQRTIPAGRQQMLRSRPAKTITRQRNDFDKQNLRAAREILQDVNLHGGEGSGVVAWARTAIWRIEGEQVAP